MGDGPSETLNFYVSIHLKRFPLALSNLVSRSAASDLGLHCSQMTLYGTLGTCINGLNNGIYQITEGSEKAVRLKAGLNLHESHNM